MGRSIADREDLLLGSLLIRNKFLSQNQLDECLAAQVEVADLGMKMRLGEVILQKGLVDAATLTATLRLQRLRMSSIHRAIEAGRRREEQEAIPIGEILVEKGFVDRETPDSRLGALAVQNRLVTKAQLDKALEVQKQCLKIGVRMKLGETLVYLKYATKRGIDSLAEIQGIRREGLVAGLAPRAVRLRPPRARLRGMLLAARGSAV